MTNKACRCRRLTDEEDFNLAVPVAAVCRTTGLMSGPCIYCGREASWPVVAGESSFSPMPEADPGEWEDAPTRPYVSPPTARCFRVYRAGLEDPGCIPTSPMLRKLLAGL